MVGKVAAKRGVVQIRVGGTGLFCFFHAMVEDDEWNPPAPAERLPVNPEHLDRFRRLMTELMFSLIGLPVFGFASVWIRPPIRIPLPSSTLPPLPEWEVQFYRRVPLFLFGLAFICLIWLVVVLLRMAELRKEKA
jgi:hypothetical protein